MFDRLFARLKADPTPDPLEADDARLALGALLVRLARIDQDYSSDETAEIDRILARRYGLDANGAASLRHGAEQVETTVGDTVHLTRLIKAAIPFEDRFALVADLWALVLADNVRDTQENAFLRLVAKLVGVNDRDSALARQSVSKTTG